MEHHVHGPVDIVIQGSHNIVYINGQRYNVPFLAPPIENQFIGRTKLLAEIKQYLFSGITQPLIVIEGLPGIGKTGLVLALAYDRDIHAHFLQGIFWASLGKHAHSALHLQRWAEVLGVAPEPLHGFMGDEEKLERIQNKIGMGHALFVLDDTWKISDIQKLRIGAPNCGYIITTRVHQIAAQLTSAQTFTLSELELEEGLQLLARFVPTVEQREAADARQLVRAVGGHPLSLVLCGAFLQMEAGDHPGRITRFLTRLLQKEKRLHLELEQEGLSRHPGLPIGTPLTLPAIIELSDSALSEQAQRILRLLTVFAAKPNSFGEAAALQITGAPDDTLFELVSANLLQKSTYVSTATPMPGLLADSFFVRYTLHQVLADYASTYTPRSEWLQMKDIQRRYASYYETLLRQADDLAIDHPAELPQTLLLFDIEWSNIHQGWEWSLQHMRADDEACNLCWQYIEAGMGRLLNLRLSPQERIHRLNQGLIAARLLERRDVEIILLHNLGDTYNDMGQAQEALQYYQLCLDRLFPSEMPTEELDEASARHVCQLYNKIAQAHHSRGEAHDVINRSGKCLLLAQEKRLPAELFDLLMNLGGAFHILGYLDRAITYYEAGLTLAQEGEDREKDPEKIGVAQVNLGLVHNQQGNVNPARECLQQALTNARKMRITRLEGNALLQMAGLSSARGDLLLALEYAHQGMQIARDVSDRFMEVDAYEQLGLAYYRLGDLHNAQVFLEQGLALAKRHQFMYSAGTLADKLGMILQARGVHSKALEIWRTGREDLEALDAGGALSLLLIHVCNTYCEHGQLIEAGELFGFLEDYTDRHSSLRLQAALLRCRAKFSQTQQKDEEARRLYEETLARLLEVQDLWEEAELRFALARLLLSSGEQLLATREAQQALTLYQEQQADAWGEQVQEWLDANI